MNLFRFLKYRRSYYVIFLICCLSALMFSGCSGSMRPKTQAAFQTESEKHETPNQEAEQKTQPQYISNTNLADCRLCGDGKGTLLPYYRGQNNVGIISLNTFTLISVETTRYDDNGKPIYKPAPSSSTNIINSGDDGFIASVSEDSDRGYAHCYIYFGNDEALDLEKASSFLCTDCLNSIMDESWETPYGIGIIDFKTHKIRLLEKDVTAFIFGDFYISCDLRDREENTVPEMDLLIFYCPERYK